jgi:hypothetical protein
MTRHITILVVEDEPLVSMMLVDDLEAAGFSVIEAANAAAVANRWPPIRIIVVSGHRTVEITDIPDGSVFYSKPYRPAEIIETMNEMLA